MKALVVHGSATEATALASQLKSLGLESESTSTADEAVHLLEGETFVALFLAWELEGSEGLALLERIRAEARWANLPVLVLTSADDVARIEQAHAAGASEFLLQPYDAQALLEKLLMLGVDPEPVRDVRMVPRPRPAAAPAPAPVAKEPEDPEARRAA